MSALHKLSSKIIFHSKTEYSIRKETITRAYFAILKDMRCSFHRCLLLHLPISIDRFRHLPKLWRPAIHHTAVDPSGDIHPTTERRRTFHNIMDWSNNILPSTDCWYRCGPSDDLSYHWTQAHITHRSGLPSQHVPTIVPGRIPNPWCVSSPSGSLAFL